jgi:hypothetical protein
MPKYAFSHPGKIGDALYTLPTIKYICERDGATADFYTSNYCLPIKSLFEYQSYIDQVIVPESYVISDMGCGIQPWNMPIPEGYDQVFQLGFKSTPPTALHTSIAQSVGIPDVPLPTYEYPDKTFLSEPYIVISARKGTTFDPLFSEFIERCPILTVQVGCPHEYLESKSVNLTHLDMLDTVALMAKSSGFLGLPFSNLVLANGFPDIPKVAMYNYAWDMRHVIYRPNNIYLNIPPVDDVLRGLNLL